MLTDQKVSPGLRESPQLDYGVGLCNSSWLLIGAIREGMCVRSCMFLSFCHNLRVTNKFSSLNQLFSLENWPGEKVFIYARGINTEKEKRKE